MLVGDDGTVSMTYDFGVDSTGSTDYEIVDNMAIDTTQAPHHLFGTTSCTGTTGRCSDSGGEHFGVSIWSVETQSTTVDSLSVGTFTQLRIDAVTPVLTKKRIVGMRPSLSTSGLTIDIILRGDHSSQTSLFYTRAATDGTTPTLVTSTLLENIQGVGEAFWRPSSTLDPIL